MHDIIAIRHQLVTSEPAARHCVGLPLAQRAARFGFCHWEGIMHPKHNGFGLNGFFALSTKLWRAALVAGQEGSWDQRILRVGGGSGNNVTM